MVCEDDMASSCEATRRGHDWQVQVAFLFSPASCRSNIGSPLRRFLPRSDCIPRRRRRRSRSQLSPLILFCSTNLSYSYFLIYPGSIYVLRSMSIETGQDSLQTINYGSLYISRNTADPDYGALKALLDGQTVGK